MLEMAARSAQILIALAGAYVVAFWFVLIVWTFRDIESRSRSVVTQVFSTLLVVLFFIPGILLYMILRPKETLDEAFQRSLEEEYLLQDLEELPLCSSCHRYVEDDFVLCPHCHAQLRESCVGCSRLVDLRWALCPYCGTVQDGRTEVEERVEAPAARWTAPEVRRRRPAPERRDILGPVAAVPSRPVANAEDPAVAAAVAAGPNGEAASETRALPFTLLSGMRSIVRPFEQHRGRNGAADGAARGASNGAGDGDQANGFTPALLRPEQDDEDHAWSDFPNNGHAPNGHNENGDAGSAGAARRRSVGLAAGPSATDPRDEQTERDPGLIETPTKRG